MADGTAARSTARPKRAGGRVGKIDGMTQRGDLNMTQDPRWPADDPWWRFTPKSLATGYLSLVAALLCLGWSVYSLLDGGLSTVFFAVFAVVSVLYLVRVNGLKVLLRRR
jgi:hypothetical protein